MADVRGPGGLGEFSSSADPELRALTSRRPQDPARAAARASYLSGLAQFLVQRDLVGTKLNKFDDRPEKYRVHKSTFERIVHTLEVTAGEELDILIKWLGT